MHGVHVEQKKNVFERVPEKVLSLLKVFVAIGLISHFKANISLHHTQ